MAAGYGEDLPPVELGANASGEIGAEDIGRAPQYDAQQDEKDRYGKAYADRGEDGREARKHQYDHQNEPDMVCLPDRLDCLSNQVAFAFLGVCRKHMRSQKPAP